MEFARRFRSVTPHIEYRRLVVAIATIIVSCSGTQGAGTGPDATNVGGSPNVGGSSATHTTRSGGATSLASTTNVTTLAGGTRATGGSNTTGGSHSTGGANATGGVSSRGGTVAGSSAAGNKSTGGTTSSVVTSSGGTKSTGGSSAGGAKSTGGMSPSFGGSTSIGGKSSAGGTKATGGTSSSTGTTTSSGATGAGGLSGLGGASASGDCTFNVVTNALSTKMATVGIVEWSTSLTDLSSASIVYTLDAAPSSTLNKGGTAPVDLKQSNYRTLLLGLKQSSSYTFHIEATSSNGTTCKSQDFSLPKTGALSGAPSITRTATNASAQAKGFIVTSAGMSGSGAFIIDADGAVVWYSAAPNQCSRARMDYEGVNMWMLSLNVGNSGGEMRFVSMDGQNSKTNISGLTSAHHDFAVLPHKVAAMLWTTSGTDPESNLVEIASDGSGTPTTVFKIGANLYAGGTSAMGGGSNKFHSNSILYHGSDDSFTIGDRNPNLYVKVSHAGTVQWQLGGTCSNAPAGTSHCVSETWQVNHGHHLLDNGNMLVFNNGSSGASHVLEFALGTTGTMTATSVKDFTSGSTNSMVLGDVQRLPNGNTLVTYSVSGQIIEVDSSWATVQTLNASSFGYADWRETLYGPPPR